MASTSPSMPGQAGVRTLYPLLLYRSAQCSQLRGVIQSPWTSTIVSGASAMASSFSWAVRTLHPGSVRRLRVVLDVAAHLSRPIGRVEAADEVECHVDTGRHS